MDSRGIIVIDKLLGQSNWKDWKFQVRIQLQCNDAMQAIDGTLLKPTQLPLKATSKDMEEYNKSLIAYNRIEYYAQGLIASSVTPEVRKLINMCTTSKHMWDKLHSIYEQRTEQRQDRLFNEFFGIREKDTSDNIAGHIARLEKLWEELKDETWKEDKVKLPDSLFLNRVLNTLPGQYL
ncbi:uncharacterized protein [Rhodnius prolixus]|uniref:uncharacterized protein n=1 Tax=Rhodnius prolixus TaxID=13249 RepID=UPI003D18C0C4